MKLSTILLIAATATLFNSSCNDSSKQSNLIIRKAVSLVSKFDAMEKYDATKRSITGNNRTRTLAHDYRFNGKDSVGQYLVSEVITDTSFYHDNIVAKHLVVLQGQDTIAIVDNEFDMLTGALKRQLVTTTGLRISNNLTWDDHNDNILSLIQHRVEYDPQSNKPTKEWQMDVNLDYSNYYSMARWSSGMARMLMGEDLDFLVFSGLMGSAPANLATKISYLEIEASPAPELMMLSQKTSEGTIKYELDKNYLVITEQFFDPHFQDNDFSYEYE